MDVVASGKFLVNFGLGSAMYVVWQSAAIPLLKHCLSMANHFQPRVRLKIAVFICRKSEVIQKWLDSEQSCL